MKSFFRLLMAVCLFAVVFVADAKGKKDEVAFPLKTTTVQDGEWAEGTEWYLISVGDKYLQSDGGNVTALPNRPGTKLGDSMLWTFVEEKGKIKIYNKAVGRAIHEQIEPSGTTYLSLEDKSNSLSSSWFSYSVESENQFLFFKKFLGSPLYYDLENGKFQTSSKLKKDVIPFTAVSISELRAQQAEQAAAKKAKQEETDRIAAEKQAAKKAEAEKKAAEEAAEFAAYAATVADKVKKSRETDFVETDAYYGAPTKFKRTYNDGTIAVYDYYVSFDKRLKITHRNGSTTTHSYSVHNTKEMNRLTEIYLCKSVENYPEIEQTSSEEELTELRSALSAAKEKANEIQRKEKQDEENRIKNEREAKEKSLIAKYGRNYVENLKQGVMSIGMPLALLQEAKDGIWIEEENRHVYVKLKMTQQTSAWTTYTYKIQKGVLYNEGAIHVNNKGKVSYIKIWENCLN